MDIIISHLDLFQIKYAFNIRLWKHLGVPIKTHCYPRFPGLTERLGLQAPLRPQKTDNIKLIITHSLIMDTCKFELEVSSSTLLAELRADIIVNISFAGTFIFNYTS